MSIKRVTQTDDAIDFRLFPHYMPRCAFPVIILCLFIYYYIFIIRGPDSDIHK